MCTQQGTGKRVGGTFDSHVSSTPASIVLFGSESPQCLLLCRTPTSHRTLAPCLGHSHASNPRGMQRHARHTACNALPTLDSPIPKPGTAAHHRDQPRTRIVRTRRTRHRTPPINGAQQPLQDASAALHPREQKSSTTAGYRASHAHDAKFVPAAEGRKRPGTRTPRPGQRIPGRPTPGSQARRLEHSASSALAVRP